MSILPEGEDLRRAVKWISDLRAADPDLDPEKVIEEACVRFDLKPLDQEFLCRHLKDEPAK